MTCSAESRAFLCSTYVNHQMENIIVLYMYIPSSRWIPDCQLADNQHKADVPCVTCWLVWQLLNFHLRSLLLLSFISPHLLLPFWIIVPVSFCLRWPQWCGLPHCILCVHLKSTMFAAALL